MRASDLIKKFSTRLALPIDVNEVVSELLSNGIKDKVYFWSVKGLDTEVIRGMMEEWAHPAAEVKDGDNQCEVAFVADVYYAAGLPLAWQRLVCCKELLHLLDAPEARVSTEAEIERLIEKIVLPADLQDPVADGIHAATDRLAVAQAAAILFPIDARNILLEPYDNGSLSLSALASFLELPQPHVAMIMSEPWEDIHELLLET